MSGDLILHEMTHFLPHWDFSYTCVVGRSDGLLTSSRKNHIMYLNNWSIPSRFGNVLFSVDFGWYFTLINIYGPNLHRQAFGIKFS